MSRPLRLALIWLVASTVTLVVTLQMAAASFLGGRYLPVGHDAFYHGRRVLDAVESGRVMQFDPLIHAPEGDWVTWPWLYDSSLAWLTRVLAAMTGGNPESVLMHLPPLLGVLGVALVVLAAASIGLPEAFVAIAALAFALHAFTQYQFGVGSLDHHGAEQLLSLAVLLLGLRWLRRADSTGRAVAIGLLLGAAVGVHAGLVVLQVPLVLACGLLWLRGDLPGFRSVAAVAAALAAGALLVLLPATTFWQPRFDLYYLSSLHLYVACASAVVLLFMARWSFTPTRLAGLVAIVILLALPLARVLMFSGDFLAGDLAAIGDIDEIRSPFSGLDGAHGFRRLNQVYTFLVWLAPLMLVLCGIMAFRERDRSLVYFWVSCCFGLLLLLLQRRLGSFGAAYLYLPLLLVVARATRRWPKRAGAIAAVTVLTFMLAYAPTLRHQLFARRVPSMDEHFSTVRYVLPALIDACMKAPGVVLADPGDGHIVRYFTNCGVVGNNFRLTPLDVRKVEATLQLIGASVSELRENAPYVRYVLARLKLPAESPDPVLFEELLEGHAAHERGLVTIIEVGSGPRGEGPKVLGVYGLDVADAASRPPTQFPASSPGT